MDDAHRENPELSLNAALVRIGQRRRVTTSHAKWIKDLDAVVRELKGARDNLLGVFWNRMLGHGTSGVRRMWHLLRGEGTLDARDTLKRLM
ncbi:MAG: hypothetical protein K2X36_07860 [Microbacteriaceae bacterium]|nr:hypothetical protein [Microbacteriaceae bacterium]